MRKALEELGAIAPPGDRGAEMRLELLERRDRGQERDVLRVEAGQDDVGEQRLESRTRRRDAAQRVDRMRLVLDIDEHELQPHRPAFDALVHARHRVGVDAIAASRLQQRASLVEAKRQVGDVERSELAVSEQIRGGERQAAAACRG